LRASGNRLSLLHTGRSLPEVSDRSSVCYRPVPTGPAEHSGGYGNPFSWPQRHLVDPLPGRGALPPVHQLDLQIHARRALPRTDPSRQARGALAYVGDRRMARLTATRHRRPPCLTSNRHCSASTGTSGWRSLSPVAPASLPHPPTPATDPATDAWLGCGWGLW